MQVLNLFTQERQSGVTLASLVLSLKISARGNRVLFINNSQGTGFLEMLKLTVEAYEGDLTPYLISDTLKREVLIHSTFKYNKNLEVLDNYRNLFTEDDLQLILELLVTEFDYVLIDNGTNGVLGEVGFPLKNVQVIPLGVKTEEVDISSGADYVIYNRIEPVYDPLEEVEKSVESGGFLSRFFKSKKTEVGEDLETCPMVGIEDLMEYAYKVDKADERGVEMPFFKQFRGLSEKGVVFAQSDFDVCLERFYNSFGVTKVVTGKMDVNDVFDKIKEFGDRAKSGKLLKGKVEVEEVVEGVEKVDG